jgi:hypothetical protein
MMQKLTNAFGALGYLGVVVQILWLGVTFGAPYLMTSGAKDLFLPRGASEPVAAAPVALPAFVEIGFIVLAVVFSVGITVYALYAVPRTVGKYGKKTVTKTATSTLPVITHHKPISKKQERQLLQRLTWGVKALFVLAPLLINLFPLHESLELSRSVVVAVAVVLAIWSTALFTLQFVVSRHKSVQPKQTW